jgi:hypothetical protein
MTWMSYAARSITLVGILPLILNKFSPGDIVLWYLFSTMISLQMLADYGLRQTFSRIISYAYGGARDILIVNQNSVVELPTDETCNEPLMASIIASMKFLYKWLTVIVFILLLTFGTWAMKKPVDNTDVPDQAWIAWGVFIVTSIISFYSKVYQNFLEGLNKVALVRRIETFTSLGGIICSLGVLVWAPSLLNLVIVNQIWIVIASFRDWLICQRTESALWKRVNIRLPIDPILLKKIWAPVWRSGVSGLMSGGLMSLTSVIYAQFGTKDSVASYLLALRLVSQIRDVSMAPFFSKIPLLARFRVQNNMQGLLTTIKKGMKWSHIVFVFGFICTTICIEPFLQVIGSEVTFIDPKLWILLGWAFYAYRFGSMHLQVYLSTNHVIAHIADGVSGIIYIGVTWLLSSHFGVYAIPVGMLSGYLGFYCWYCTKYSYKSLNNINFWYFEKGVSVPSIIVLLLFSIFYFFNS